MLHFATYFDINYLSRGLALFDSLKRHSSRPFILHILALDEIVVGYFNENKTDGISVIPLAAIEAYFPELQQAKSNRSIIEYYFTLSPYLPLYILNKVANVSQVTTVDADIYFFDDPAIIFEQYSEASILITPHNFSKNLQHLAIHGKYNVSFQSFKKDEAGLSCLNHWRQQCFNWCYDTYDEANNRFADQKYLDTWPAEFDKVAEIKTPGAGLAPWNIDNHDFKIVDGEITVDQQPLIYYHFHHLRVFNKNFAFNGLEHYGVKNNTRGLKRIYHIYLKALKSFTDKANTDFNTLRYNNHLNSSFSQKLKSPQGYWFYNNYVIVHVNPHRRFTKIKRALRSLYGPTD
ncbi:glycosyl transferase [Mucilaginibacter sp. 14171R-50]|uniref:glycosyl transferase n=1 Tax=Mucilaginibacter sp. 14171R-50 TaxID=2703789 RepID=UPI00138BB28C|nr:glycosyl transferase [Mucilaginibacter sp. 14171R-50]QHS56347.1 glycosyl transferase [Mucilaginibacter sp. 14171R-50]